MEVVEIDGSLGEGGGQVLRTSLTLGLLTQKTIDIVNIRAKRKKPGLLRQHLTCVRAIQTICDGQVEGDEIGSSRVRFTPGKVRSGEYKFSVGTAGSTVLVCQTILLPLAFCDGESKVTFEGGTHNGMSPSVTFLEQSFLPVLKKMGLCTEVNFETFGFYPAGGGRWSITINPVKRLSPISLVNIAETPTDLAAKISITAVVSQLPISIAEREINTVVKRLKLTPEVSQLESVSSPGPGNTLIIGYQHGVYQSVFEMVGEFGVSAERVAKRAVGRLQKLLLANVCVEEHLADQLLLPMLLAGQGSYTTTEPSLHTKTNIQVINLITGVEIQYKPLDGRGWQIVLNRH